MAREEAEAKGMYSTRTKSVSQASARSGERSKMSALHRTGMSSTSKKSKPVDRDAEFQKLVQAKLHEISNFSTAEPPGEEYMQNILDKNKFYGVKEEKNEDDMSQM